jgi:hypothetical protein
MRMGLADARKTANLGTSLAVKGATPLTDSDKKQKKGRQKSADKGLLSIPSAEKGGNDRSFNLSNDSQELYDHILESRDEIGELEFSSQQPNVLGLYYNRGTKVLPKVEDTASDEGSEKARRKSSGASSTGGSGKKAGWMKSKIAHRMGRHIVP